MLHRARGHGLRVERGENAKSLPCHSPGGPHASLRRLIQANSGAPANQPSSMVAEP